MWIGENLIDLMYLRTFHVCRWFGCVIKWPNYIVLHQNIVSDGCACIFPYRHIYIYILQMGYVFIKHTKAYA